MTTEVDFKNPGIRFSEFIKITLEQPLFQRVFKGEIKEEFIFINEHVILLYQPNIIIAAVQRIETILSNVQFGIVLVNKSFLQGSRWTGLFELRIYKKNV